MDRICIFIAFFGVLSLNLSMVETTMHAASWYRAIPSPNLTSTFVNSSDQEIIGCKDRNKCSLLCLKDEQCEAAVYDSSTKKCSLLYKDVPVTTVCQPNDLVYLQKVGSDWTTVGDDWPSYCPKPVKVVFKDCQEAFEYGERSSGVYELTIQGYASFKVWCNFDDDHGWTVVQRRQDGSVDFYLDWDDYKKGFGVIDGEYWLGNDNIYELTKTNQKLHFYLESTDGDYKHANYSQFYINDESDFYKMTLSTVDYSGDKYEWISYHNQMMFTTKDSDHDKRDSENCAESFKGGWWYKSCCRVNVNGVYSSNGVADGWFSYEPLLKVTMELSRD